MLLAHEKLARLIADGRIGWSGSLRGDALLLHLGGPLLEFRRQTAPVDLYNEESIRTLYGAQLDQWQTYVLEPRGLVLGQVRDHLKLPLNLVGWICTLSHVARVGLSTHLCSPLVERGFDGFLTLELSNCGSSPLVLRSGMPVAKLVISEIDPEQQSALTNRIPYGPWGQLGSRYAEEFGTDDRPEESDE